jgi:hypothetical protein
VHLKQRHLLSKSGVRRWYFEVGIPVLIPPEGREVLGRIEIYGPAALVKALERLATLGSNWASAALATILLYPDGRGTREIERARALLMRPVSEGHAYSMYVMAWAEIFSGNKDAAFRLLKSSAHAGFSPAVLDLAAAFQSKDRQRSAVMTMQLLSRAESMGHLVARGRIFRLWIAGRMGWMHRISGLFGFAYTSVRLNFNLWRDPLSQRVFCIHDKISNPPVRRVAGDRQCL